MRHPSPKRKIAKAVASALLASTAHVSSSANQFNSSTGVDEGDFFHLPIWGLRITDDSAAKPPNDTWRDFGAGPAILKVRPAVFDFGEVTAGSEAISETVTLKNIGTKALMLGSFAMPEQYTADSNCEGAYLPPLAECTYTFTLTPVSEQDGMLEIGMPFTAAPDTIDGPTLEGNALVRVSAHVNKPEEGAPEVGITPPSEEDDTPAVAGPDGYSLRFTPTYLGWPTETKTFELKASGEQPLDIKSVQITKLPVLFSTTNDCPAAIQPGDSCTVSVTFNPLELGELEGELVVETTAYNGTNIRVPLSAEVNVWDRRIEYSTHVDFGTAEQDSNATAYVSFKNIGALDVASIAIKDIGEPFAVLKNDCSGRLEPKESCSISFSMQTDTLGEFTGGANVESADLSQPAPPLTFSGKVVRTDGVFHPTVFDFGKQGASTMATPRTITFTNTGTVKTTPDFGNKIAPVRKELADRGVTGFGHINDDEWALLDNAGCKYGVEPGQSCTVGVSVWPTSFEAQDMKFVATPAKGLASKGTTIQVKVSGADQSFVFNPTILDFGLVPGGATRALTVNVINTSPEKAFLTGFSASVTQPEENRGALTLNNGSCANETGTSSGCSFTLTLKAQANGERLIAESDNSVVSFRFSGAKEEFTEIPVKFLLQGTEPQVVESSLDFGTSAVGVEDKDTPLRTLTVFNPGPSIAPINGFTPTGLPAGVSIRRDAAVSNNCGSTLAAGATCKIGLRLVSQASTKWGAATGTVVVNTLADGVSVPMANPVSLSANFSTPTMAVPAHTHIDAGEHLSSAHLVDVSLNYEGSAVLMPLEAQAGGDATAQFVGCEAGQVIKATTKCQVRVNVPAQQGVAPRSSAFDVYLSNAGEKVHQGTISVDIATEGAKFTVSETSWNAGNVPAQLWLAQGEANPHTKSFVVTNTSSRAGVPFSALTSPANWLKINYSGKVGDTSYSTCSATVLAPGKQCVVAVSVAAPLRDIDSVGAKKATFTLSTVVSPGDTQFNVEAAIQPANVGISAAEHFVDVSSGTRNVQNLILRNNGQGNAIFAPGNFLTAETTGTSYPAFGFPGFDPKKASGSKEVLGLANNPQLLKADLPESTPCSAAIGLAPGAACTIPLQFSPRGIPSNFSGMLTVKLNEPTMKSIEVPVTGNSIAGTIYFSSDTFEFPDDMLVGQTYTSEILVGNGGSGPLSISTHLSSASLPNTEFSYKHNCPTSLAVGAECVVEVTLTPDRNIDWYESTAAVYVYHNEGGNQQNKHLKLNGLSDGAYFELSSNIIKDLTVEAAVLPRTKVGTVTVKSVGEAPVKVVSVLSTVITPFQIANNYCNKGATLQPGQTCTFDVNILNGNPTPRLGNNFNVSGNILQMSGNEKETPANIYANIELEGKTYPSNSNTTYTPSLLPANRDIDVLAMQHYAQPGVVIDINGQSTTFKGLPPEGSPYKSNVAGVQQDMTFIEVPVPATGTPQTLPAVYKSRHVGSTYVQNLASADYNLYLPGERSDGVYSTQPGLPILAGALTGSLGLSPLEGGGSLMVSRDYRGASSTAAFVHGLYMFDDKGRPISRLELPVNETTNLRSSAVISPYPGGAKVFIFEHSSKDKGTNYYDYAYHRSWVSLYDVKMSGNTLSSVDKVYSKRFDSVSSQHYQYAAYASWTAAHYNHATKENVAVVKFSTGNSWYVGESPELGSFAFPSVFTGNSWNQANEGVVLHENYLYILSDNSVYTAELYMGDTGTVQSRDWTRFQFPDALTATNRETKNIRAIVYDTNRNMLLLPCYNYSAICSLPAREGGVGIMQVVGGNAGNAGFSDGSLWEATISVGGGLFALNEDSTKLGFINNLVSAQRPRVIVLNPDVYSQNLVSARNPEFQLVKSTTNQTAPYDIILENKSLIPLNVTSLSKADIAYTSDCNNAAFGATCKVTIEVPYTAWSTATTGSFLINNTVGAPVTIKWTAPE